MGQFTAYENRNPATRKRYPLLLSVQSDLLASMETCAVVPLFPVQTTRTPSISALSPILSIGGSRFVMLTPLVAGLDVTKLGKASADLSHERATIMAALDVLISGI